MRMTWSVSCVKGLMSLISTFLLHRGLCVCALIACVYLLPVAPSPLAFSFFPLSLLPCNTIDPQSGTALWLLLRGARPSSPITVEHAASLLEVKSFHFSWQFAFHQVTCRCVSLTSAVWWSLWNFPFPLAYSALPLSFENMSRLPFR